MFALKLQILEHKLHFFQVCTYSENLIIFGNDGIFYKILSNYLRDLFH